MLPGADGKPLKPTTAEQFEAGLKFQPPGSSDLYSIAIYDLTQKDVATRDPNIATATYIPAGKCIPVASNWKRTIRSRRS